MTNGQGDEVMLVNRSRSGDRAAFEELVRRCARGLFARVYVQTGDVHRAEDLMQETFLRAWRRISSLSDPKLFRGWLNTIANGVVVDSARHETRRKRGWWASKQARDEQAIEKLVDTSPGPMQASEREEERREILAMLKDLPPEYRDVIALRYLAGADYQEIGRQLAISNGSLRGLLSRGMKMLRERLGVATDGAQMNTDK